MLQDLQKYRVLKSSPQAIRLTSTLFFIIIILGPLFLLITELAKIVGSAKTGLQITILLSITIAVFTIFKLFQKNRNLFGTKAKETYSKLSVVGLIKIDYRKKYLFGIVIGIVNLLLLATYSLKFNTSELLSGLVVLPLSLAILLVITIFFHQALLHYRVRKGLYGARELEAREIIEFINKNSKNIDFTSGTGQKSILDSSDLEKLEESIRKIPNFAQPSRA